MFSALRIPLASAVATLTLFALPQAAGAAISYEVDAAKLYVTITDSSDVAITCVTGTVRLNATNTGAQCSLLQGIQVGGGSGDNTIDLDGVEGPAFDPAKFSGQIYIDGGAGADSITGSHFADYINAGAQNDTLVGNGAPPSEYVNDVLAPGSGSDTLIGDGAGFENVYFSGSSLNLEDGPGLAGELHTQEAGELDTFTGVDHVWLLGTGGSDSLDAHLYTRTALAIYGDSGQDEIWGPADAPAGAPVWLQGENGSDTIHGGDAGEFVSGGHENDSIEGGGGDDVLDGQFGDDMVSGGSGADTVTARLFGGGGLSPTTLTVPGDAGTDTLAADIETADISGDYSTDTLDASQWTGKLVFHGQEGDDRVLGGSGPNELHGDEGRDHLTGGTGADALHGGPDNDLLDGAGGVDTYAAGAGADDLRALDGVGENAIDCGDDGDVLYSDPFDSPGTGCETVRHEVPAPPGSGNPVVPGGGTTPPPPGDGGVPDAPKVAKLVIGRPNLSRSGVVTVRVTCPVDEALCQIRSSLISARKIGRKKVTFGRFAADIARGESRTIRMTLSKQNVRLLRKRGRVDAQLTVRVTDSDSNRATITREVALKLPRR